MPQQKYLKKIEKQEGIKPENIVRNSGDKMITITTTTLD